MATRKWYEDPRIQQGTDWTASGGAQTGAGGARDWGSTVNSLYNQINNREYQFDPNSPMVQAVKNQFVQQGQRAMQDTIGQAAALTGGYNNSYGQSAGQQSYNNYMLQFADQLQGIMAQDRAAWDAEGDRLLQRLNLAQGMLDRDQEAQRYEREYQDKMDYQNWQMQQTEQGNARDLALMMIQTGQTPSEEALKAAGMDVATARALASYYANQLAGAGGSGGGGGSGRGGGGYGSGSGSGSGSGNLISDADANRVLSIAKSQGIEAARNYLWKNFPAGDYDNYDKVIKWLTDEYNAYLRGLTKSQSGGGGGMGARSGETRSNYSN